MNTAQTIIDYLTPSASNKNAFAYVQWLTDSEHKWARLEHHAASGVATAEDRAAVLAHFEALTAKREAEYRAERRPKRPLQYWPCRSSQCSETVYGTAFGHYCENCAMLYRRGNHDL